RSLAAHHTTSPRRYPLSLHDALPILVRQLRFDAHNQNEYLPLVPPLPLVAGGAATTADWGSSLLRDSVSQGDARRPAAQGNRRQDRKSTRLNSSHTCISYAVLCMQKT